MVKDKNGVEIKIGDTVHYFREARVVTGIRKTLFGLDEPYAHKVRAKDITFVVGGFKHSPFSRANDSRYNENPLWVTGSNGDNSISPLALVKINTMFKKSVFPFKLKF